jgi:glycogen operon protein
MSLEILSGQSNPLGATLHHDGVNFSIFSKHASGIQLLLFAEPNSPAPYAVVDLDPRYHKTFFYWHIFVKGLSAGQVYAYRVFGPDAPEAGHRFDGEKVLLDPYAKAIVGYGNYQRQAAIAGGDNCRYSLRGVVVDPCGYDWEDDYHPRIPYSETVIYELHVGGFTKHPNSGVAPEKRGTFAGLIEKIPYLKELGITTVELLPVHAFDREDAVPPLRNYWGYSTLNFFAPHHNYSSDKSPLGPVNEFRDLVKALHREGIEVILDVVFNHTAEGNHQGPTISFRGIDNKTYYILEKDMRYYSNYSGCGNTFRGNHPVVGGLILDSLRYWVSEMHVDGFRFDLASVLARDSKGLPLTDNPRETPNILWAIESDPVLAGTKLIAEAWDAAGLYSVGNFIEYADWFAEWNGPYRDDVRSFVKSDPGTVTQLAARILGSPDIYRRLDRDVNRSINFITCHDGFTLNDLVSYNVKHNETNGEDNRDGCHNNHSWNCGTEGDTKDPEIAALRLRQIKNFFTILFMSQGTPMLHMGDEVRHTKKGNNNTYCQDNPLSWFDWSAREREGKIRDFVGKLIHFSQNLELFKQECLLDVTYASYQPHLSWHGVKLGQPDWSFSSHSLAFSLQHPEADEYLHIIFNAYWESLEFELPIIGHGDRWHRIIDTALPLPEAFQEVAQAPAVFGHTYRVEARSSVVLMVKPQGTFELST